MNLLPDELVIEIFNQIQKITDKRNFLRTCKKYNKITSESMSNYVFRATLFNCPHYYCVDKYTLELCHDGYFNLIPEHYINKNNKMLIPCLAYYNNIELLELAISKGCSTHDIVMYAALGGHISVLEWCAKNNYSLYIATHYAIQGGHLHILKWLQSNNIKFNVIDNSLCNCAADNGHLEILKFLRGIGCPWNDTTYLYALDNGNKELVKWMEENGCPTN